jgi:hypothetical protein
MSLLKRFAANQLKSKLFTVYNCAAGISLSFLQCYCLATSVNSYRCHRYVSHYLDYITKCKSRFVDFVCLSRSNASLLFRLVIIKLTRRRERGFEQGEGLVGEGFEWEILEREGLTFKGLFFVEA